MFHNEIVKFNLSILDYFCLLLSTLVHSCLFLSILVKSCLVLSTLVYSCPVLSILKKNNVPWWNCLSHPNCTVMYPHQLLWLGVVSSIDLYVYSIINLKVYVYNKHARICIFIFSVLDLQTRVGATGQSDLGHFTLSPCLETSPLSDQILCFSGACLSIQCCQSLHVQKVDNSLTH